MAARRLHQQWRDKLHYIVHLYINKHTTSISTHTTVSLNNLGYPYIWPSHCKDSQITSLKLCLIVTLFVNFKHNFHKENETFSPKKLKRFKEKSLKMEPFLSELPYHIYDWLIISLKDFCIVIRKWPTFLPSTVSLLFLIRNIL